MTESDALKIGRLRVALDAMRCSSGDWDAAMDLAALIGVELQGLFVQDADLLGLAALPIAHEVGRLSGQPRPLARESLETVLKRRLERTASALERAGKLRNVPVTHATARGKLVRRALEQGERGDVVFLVGPGAHAERSRAQRQDRIMLWYDDGPSARQAIELALYLAHRTGAELVIGFPSVRFPSAKALREHLGALLASAPHHLRLMAFGEARIDTLLDVARGARIARIVLGAEGPTISVDALEHLFAGFHGELIVVR